MITLHPLHVGPEEQGLREVGRADTGVFVALPPEGVAILDWLSDGISLDEVERRFAGRYGAPPQLIEFVEELTALGFVRAIDNDEIQPRSAVGAEIGRWNVLSTLPGARVAWLLSRPMRYLYWATWVALAAVFTVRPDLFPRAADALVFPSALANVACLIMLGWVLILVHELGHLFAARARDCPATLSISRRLYFLIAQTNMSSVRILPRGQRYAPYLAGMTVHAGILLAATSLRAAGIAGPLPPLIAYLVVIQLAFQCAIFLRTDLYYVITNRLRLGNLAEDTRHVLANRWARISNKQPPTDPTEIPPRDRRIATWYAPFYLLGLTVAIATFALYGLPVMITMTIESIYRLTHGATLAKLDGGLFLLAIATNLGLPLLIRWRERHIGGRSPQANP